ncbi:hypothetical protein GA0111570_101228 [Raineyella antarctica]|uniref:Uncharacterized protein n=1 Tax=Raineyella antarctica TaxID=1577474 RepID=A0A1G6GDY3_9ACTN|nr:hypothetical protein [Raineyella antarctica]SDB79955.1 hypothetical protein GA0111570_101228 [Raineyella antarctica]
MLHVLSLRPAVHLASRPRRLGPARQVPIAHYLELLVDGVPLDRLVAHGAGLVTPLQGWWLLRTSPVVDELLGRTEDLRLPDGFAPIRYLEPGRVPLLVGPWDDDIHDGWLTARVTIGPRTATWDEFRWENGGIGAAEAVRGLPDVLTFERSAYEATLEAARARVAALPEVVPETGSWRDDERIPGVPAGLERAWGTWARLRHRGTGHGGGLR